MGTIHPRAIARGYSRRGYKEFVVDEDTIIIGHSAGAVAILGLVQSLPDDVRVQACYLVAAFKDNLDWDALSDLFVEPFEFERIKKKSCSWHLIHSDNDPYCPLEHAQFLREKLNGELIVLPNQKHFSVGTYGESYRQFPFLFRLIAGDGMRAEDVVALYQTMDQRGVGLWIDGGWGVDALLEKQTRPHADLDVVVEKKDLAQLDSHLRSEGYSEVVRGDSSHHNYVLGNSDCKFVDIHVIGLDENGNGLYGPREKGEVFPADSLTGTGMINDQKVRCISPEWVVKFHTGYELRDLDRLDVRALCEKFGLELPSEYRE